MLLDFHYRPRADYTELVHRADLSGCRSSLGNEFQPSNRWKMLVSWQDISLKSVCHHSEFVWDLFDLLHDLFLVVISKQLRVVDCDHELIIQKVFFYCRFEICHIIQTNWANFSAQNQNLIITWRTHLSNFRFSPQDPQNLICCSTIHYHQVNDIIVVTWTHNFISDCTLRLWHRLKNMHTSNPLYLGCHL